MRNRRFDRRTFVRKVAEESALAAGRARFEMSVVPLDPRAEKPARTRSEGTQFQAETARQPQQQ